MIAIRDLDTDESRRIQGGHWGGSRKHRESWARSVFARFGGWPNLQSAGALGSCFAGHFERVVDQGSRAYGLYVCVPNRPLSQGRPSSQY